MVQTVVRKDKEIHLLVIVRGGREKMDSPSFVHLSWGLKRDGGSIFCWSFFKGESEVRNPSFFHLILVAKKDGLCDRFGGVKTNHFVDPKKNQTRLEKV